ncbi:MAG: YggT family protein [Candidatus Eremiobacteraeota bacterium]|nr:YggT family protein [Candidatus Eremiobacteraeota bacterium]
MNALLCQLDQLAVWLIRAYLIVLLIYAVLSWIPDIRGPWVRYFAMLVEPVLTPIRRIVPPVGGLDLAFLVVILVLNFLVIPLVTRAAYAACLPY